MDKKPLCKRKNFAVMVERKDGCMSETSMVEVSIAYGA